MEEDGDYLAVEVGDDWREMVKAELTELIWLIEEKPACGVNDVSDRIRALHEFMELQRKVL
ncbi:hypothetical protein IQ273_30790 [Nodosilinea sp. LEGE 07298]|uniref:hypothetical protein n=1 Tax=Nodosilinea sp. LEGE 07298 TaxID=2777970 RepID=UPI001882DA63|nr:hypothetical protein [Nodosilinea sp. LEGE 07298]MBE9113761.1 hypothetical protein [Nodosilinea sp. LEGE 07298]